MLKPKHHKHSIRIRVIPHIRTYTRVLTIRKTHGYTIVHMDTRLFTLYKGYSQTHDTDPTFKMHHRTFDK